jgi:DNA-binding NarL/FixJ family response regulator
LGIADCVLHLPEVPEAMDYLRGCDGDGPSVVVLRLNGAVDQMLNALKTVKAEERLQSVPVVTLASSDDGRLVDQSFALGAAGHMVERTDPGEFAEAIRMIHDYWSLSELPKHR